MFSVALSLWLATACFVLPFGTGLQPVSWRRQQGFRGAAPWRAVEGSEGSPPAFDGFSCGAFKLEQLRGGAQAQRVAAFLETQSPSSSESPSPAGLSSANGDEAEGGSDRLPDEEVRR